MASHNAAQLIGNLTKDVDTREAGSTTVANFSIAVNERVKKGGEWQDHVEYFDIVFFGKTAETCRDYLSKGSQVFVTGRIQIDKYTDKEGVERRAIKIIGDKLVMLGSKDGGKKGGSGGAPRDSYQEPGLPDDDIPFHRAPSFYDAM